MIDLRQGDCLELMKNIPDKSIDMILCDLPYGTTTCKWDVIISFEPLWEQYNRIIKDNGAIVLFGKQPFTTDLIMSNRKLFKYELIWEKDKPTNFALANKQPMCYHENILVFYKKQPIYNKQLIKREGSGSSRCEYGVNHKNRTIHGTNKKYTSKKEKDNYDKEFKNPKSILYYDTGRRQDLYHPTQKPVALLEYLIKTYTNESETVLDNCMGSGSTGVACKKLNRNFIGIELDENYYKIACERINNTQEKVS